MDETDTASPPLPMTDADVSASEFATANVSVTPDGFADRPGGSADASGSEPDPEPALATGVADEGSAGMGGGPELEETPAEPVSIKQTLADKTTELRGQTGDKVRQFAETGKDRATGALDDLARMLSDAADQVDEKLGAQFGQYARSTAEGVQSFSSSLGNKSVDDLVDVAREFVRKSPAAAIGVATALGFVVARLAASGLDQRDQA